MSETFPKSTFQRIIFVIPVVVLVFLVDIIIIVVVLLLHVIDIPSNTTRVRGSYHEAFSCQGVQMGHDQFSD